jgi:diguanylate cyclase (GGDEF)-like protein
VISVSVPALPREAGEEAAGDRVALSAMAEMVRSARKLGRSADDLALLGKATSIACKVFGSKWCAIALHREDGNFYGRFLSLAAGLERQREGDLVLSGSAYQAMCQAASEEGGVLWLADDDPVHAAPAVLNGLFARGASGQKHTWTPVALVWAPIVGDDGDQLGFLSTSLPGGRHRPLPHEAALLSTLAEVAALGLDVQRATAEGSRNAAVAFAQRRQLEELIAASLEVRGRAGLDEILAGIARAMTTAVGFQRATVYLVEPGCEKCDRPEDTPVSLVAGVGLDPVEVERLKATFTNLTSFAPMMRPEMRLSGCYFYDHRYFELPPGYKEEMAAAPEREDWVEGTWHPDDSLTVPLEDPDGNFLGLISMDEPLSGKLPTEDDCRALEYFAQQCATAVAETRRLQAALEEANTDELTGLANRRGLLERAPKLVEEAKRDGSALAALFVDIDNFKDINDSFGHAFGDEVIGAVGGAIGKRLRRGDLVARVGGEEFVALLPQTSLEEAVALAEKVRLIMSSPDLVPVHPPLVVRVSVGVAALGPGQSPRELLAAADSALYRAKGAGRDRVCVAPA